MEGKNYTKEIIKDLRKIQSLGKRSRAYKMTGEALAFFSLMLVMFALLILVS